MHTITPDSGDARPQKHKQRVRVECGHCGHEFIGVEEHTLFPYRDINVPAGPRKPLTRCPECEGRCFYDARPPGWYWATSKDNSYRRDGSYWYTSESRRGEQPGKE